jgi:hypothetical protein
MAVFVRDCLAGQVMALARCVMGSACCLSRRQKTKSLSQFRAEFVGANDTDLVEGISRSCCDGTDPGP